MRHANRTPGIEDRGPAVRRLAKGGTLILGGGFGGAYVARSLGKQGATIVSPDSSMLYTPLLPEVAAGAIEPRHVAVPLRMMSPHAELVLGSAAKLDEHRRLVTVIGAEGETEIEYQRLVVAVGSIASWLPIPGLAEHGFGFKSLRDAVHLRNHILRKLDAADSDPANAERHLTFVFVGAGYAGVEALAELRDLVRDAVRYHPNLHGVPQRWVLVNRSDRILSETPGDLGAYTARLLERRGVEIRSQTTLTAVEKHAVSLSDGSRIETDTVIWTAGVKPSSLLAEFGLPLDERGRVRVDSRLCVLHRPNIWALGDCAAVPNEATPGRFDPPTCQHALRQARRVAANMLGEQRPYRYRSLGQGATLGRDKGIANVLGVFSFKGRAAALFMRANHIHQIPLFSRRLRVVTDGWLSIVFGRDMAELGVLEQGPARPPAVEVRAEAA
jgi:NADH:ubiquinone reductase (H+-translocating)